MTKPSDTILSFFRTCMGVTRAMELMLVDVIAALIPWLAPVIPAYMAWQHMTSVLEFPGWVAGVGAAVVEFLGLSTVHTTFTFWQYNDERAARRVQHQTKARVKRKTQPKRAAGAPVLVAGITAGVYLAVIITVNVLLDDAAMIERMAKALLSLLGTVAAVTLAIRAQHARRLSDADERKAQIAQARIETRNLLRNVAQPTVQGRAIAQLTYDDFAQAIASNGSHGWSGTLIAKQFGVSRRTGNYWLNKWRKDHPHPESQNN